MTQRRAITTLILRAALVNGPLVDLGQHHSTNAGRKNLGRPMAWQFLPSGTSIPQRRTGGIWAAMRQRIVHYRRDDALLDPRVDQVIGCRVLSQPAFWPKDLWLPVPTTFSPYTQQGRGYSTDTEEGRAICSAVVERIAGIGFATPSPDTSQLRYGAPALVVPWLGQGAFRLAVTDSYERRCAVTGERTRPILDAAHIHPFADGGTHDVANGLLLRTDIHRLFDLGYVTVSEDRQFQVSRRLKADFDNGQHYNALDGRPVGQPRRGVSPTSTDALRWHREHRFRG